MYKDEEKHSRIFLSSELSIFFKIQFYIKSKDSHPSCFAQTEHFHLLFPNATAWCVQSSIEHPTWPQSFSQVKMHHSQAYWQCTHSLFNFRARIISLQRLITLIFVFKIVSEMVLNISKISIFCLTINCDLFFLFCNYIKKKLAMHFCTNKY